MRDNHEIEQQEVEQIDYKDENEVAESVEMESMDAVEGKDLEWGARIAKKKQASACRDRTRSRG